MKIKPYILINFKVDNNIINQLNELIKFNDHILRHLIMNIKETCTEPSHMNKDQLKSVINYEFKRKI